jgi:hypothetical protein
MDSRKEAISTRTGTNLPAFIEESEYPDIFEGLGMDLAVPKFLRFKGKIKNRKLHKKACLEMIRSLLQEKKQHESKKKQSKSKMSQFISLYLKKKFGSPDVVTDYAYNIYYASQYHGKQNAECEVFFRILNEEYDDSKWQQIQDIEQNLRLEFLNLDKELHGIPRAYVPKLEALDLLRDHFQNKNAGELRELQAALEVDQSGKVHYEWLFENDENGVFLNTLRRQSF